MIRNIISYKDKVIFENSKNFCILCCCDLTIQYVNLLLK